MWSCWFGAYVEDECTSLLFAIFDWNSQDKALFSAHITYPSHLFGVPLLGLSLTPGFRLTEQPPLRDTTAYCGRGESTLEDLSSINALLTSHWLEKVTCLTQTQLVPEGAVLFYVWKWRARTVWWHSEQRGAQWRKRVDVNHHGTDLAQ